MEAGDQQLVHTPFTPSGYWSPCAPLVWNPVKAPDIRFSSSHFRKQHPWCKKAVSRTSLAEAIYAWPCGRISRGSVESFNSRPYQGFYATAPRGDFCLPGFPPGLVRPSLDDLDNPTSDRSSVLNVDARST
ncbi:unnamed protein product [Schistosoma curassoni]|uniref:Uncharacterized protein n=1 Tax=Schistosoma curassoni TaxID=6186 RepID=A0A183K352_9TREM|nr:unnamed protein product [Schistosoma curassoni]